MTDPLHSLEFRLAYSECDPAGIVYYAAYHPWMERVHTDWTYERGIRTDQMLDRYGVGTVSRHSEVTYNRPSRIFDPLRCEMRLDALGTTSFRMRFDFLHREDGDSFAVGRFTLVFVDADQRKTPVPDWMQEHLLSSGPPLTA
jgi:acyl-CoA thioester hydrolase